MAHRFQHHAEVLLTRRAAAALACALAMAACGGGSSGGPNAPETPGPATTITITANGVAPQNVTIDVGARIRWVNNDNRIHEMSSDPHPEHTQCPQLNAGPLSPGASRDTANLTIARTCGFHDHQNPDQQNLWGTVTIR